MTITPILDSIDETNATESTYSEEAMPFNIASHSNLKNKQNNQAIGCIY